MTGAPFVGIDARRTTPAEPAVRMCAQSVIGKRINTHTALTVDEWRRVLAAHRAVPGTCVFRCVSGACEIPGLPGRAAQDDAGPDGEREVRR